MFSETVNRSRKYDDRELVAIYLLSSLKLGNATPRLIGNVDN